MEYLLKKGQPDLRQSPLEYGAKYKLYRDGEYLGEGTFTDDQIHGDVFLHTYEENGEQYADVFCADEWVLIL